MTRRCFASLPGGTWVNTRRQTRAPSCAYATCWRRQLSLHKCWPRSRPRACSKSGTVADATLSAARFDQEQQRLSIGEYGFLALVNDTEDNLISRRSMR